MLRLKHVAAEGVMSIVCMERLLCAVPLLLTNAEP